MYSTFLSMIFYQHKKNLTCRGKPPSGHCCKREDLFTQAKKTPEPLSHPDTVPVRTGPVLFDLCFSRRIDEAIFLTLATNLLPRRVELRT
jgi:hypothetical protein